MQFTVLPEPDLYFSENRPCIDPQVGLLNFGPHGGTKDDEAAPKRILAGAIGTERSIRALELWLQVLRHRINDEKKPGSRYQHIDFPGLALDGPLRFDIVVDKGSRATLNPKLVEKVEKERVRKRRILALSEEYVRLLTKLEEAYPKPQIIFLPLDDLLLQLCKDPWLRTDRIRYRARSFKESDSEEEPEPSRAEEDAEESEGLFDFHNYLKAQAAIRGFTTQMLQPDTLTFAENRQSAAVIGWNIAVAIYYKATGIPWKLADIDDRTCYVGVSFYQDLRRSQGVMRACVAQVYMRTAESQVVRGEPFRWDPYQTSRQVHVSAPQMKEIVSKAVRLYKDQKDAYPDRVVVHKPTAFYEEELEGCAQGAEPCQKIDVVYVSDFTKFRAYHLGEEYPVVRGTMIGDGNQGMLFTAGFIPALGTFPGSGIPAPLRLIAQRLDSNIDQVAGDVMGLTKLDWNSSAFATRLPVTISVPRKVGAVMAEMAATTPTPPSNYRFYM